MALIDKTYFKGNRFIPNLNEAEPNNRLQEDLMMLMQQSDKDVLSLAFGFEMWEDFKQFINENGGIKEETPQNYKDVVNGKTYQKDGKTLRWNGILETNPKASLLADIVCYQYHNNNVTQTTENGQVMIGGKLGDKASSVPKIIECWNSFVEKFNGGYRDSPSGFTKDGKPYWVLKGGIDYYGIYPRQSGEVSLIQFLADNKADYPLLQEEIEFVGFQKKNSFGL